MRAIFVLLLWQIGWRGNKCRCSFYEASHYNHKLEFDMEDYPCRNFTQIEGEKP